MKDWLLDHLWIVPIVAAVEIAAHAGAYLGGWQTLVAGGIVGYIVGAEKARTT